MNSTHALPEELVRYARLRGGVFTTTEARDHDVTSSHLKAAVQEDQCHRVVPGLYSLSPTLDTNARIWSGLLHAGPHSALGGDAAAFVRGEGPEPEAIDIWTGHRSLKDRLDWHFHSGPPPAPDSADVVDEEFGALAAMRRLPHPLARERAQGLLALTDRQRFLALAETPTPDGLSVLETLFLHDVERRHGLPHASWKPAQDGQQSRLHARFPGLNTRVVLDGSSVGRGREWWHRDQDHGISYCGEEVVLTISWWGLTRRPCETAYKLAELLWRSGWMGLFPECSLCNPSPFVPKMAPLYLLHAGAMDGGR